MPTKHTPLFSRSKRGSRPAHGPNRLEATIGNLLWAIGETERIFFNVLEPVDGYGPHLAPYSVEGLGFQQMYRMTYVPLLLLLGLLSCIFAASISVALLLLNWHSRTDSFLSWRALDPIRLLVDAVTGLSDDDGVRSMHGQHNKTLDEWGERYNVRIAKRLDDKSANIVLQPVELAQKQEFHGGLRQRWRSFRDLRNKTNG